MKTPIKIYGYLIRFSFVHLQSLTGGKITLFINWQTLSPLMMVARLLKGLELISLVV